MEAAAAARQGEELSQNQQKDTAVQLTRRLRSPGTTTLLSREKNRSEGPLFVVEADTENIEAIPTLPRQPHPVSPPSESEDCFSAPAPATATRQSPEIEGDSNGATRQWPESEGDWNGDARRSQESEGDSTNGATRQSQGVKGGENGTTRHLLESEGDSNVSTRRSPEGDGDSDGATRQSLESDGDSAKDATSQSQQGERYPSSATRQSLEGLGDSNGGTRQSLEGDERSHGATEAAGDGQSWSTTPSTKFPHRPHSLPVAGTKQRIQVVVRIRPVDELPSRYEYDMIHTAEVIHRTHLALLWPAI